MTTANGTFRLIEACVALALASAGALSAAEPLRIRIAFSRDTLGEMNETDARAAIRIWSESIAKQAGMDIDDNSAALLSPGDLLRAIRNRALDGFVLTAPEYVEVAGLLDQKLMADEKLMRQGEQYLLLVHASSGIQNLADLAGHELHLYKNPRMCLAPMWLATLFGPQYSARPQPFFSRVTKESKLAQAVLPVYFRKADACVVTRQGFETMCELNPQLGRTLRVLATSPKLMPYFCAFRKDCPLAIKERMRYALSHLHETTAGQQVLMLFEVRRLYDVDASAFQESAGLIEAFNRLQAKAPGGTQ